MVGVRSLLGFQRTSNLRSLAADVSPPVESELIQRRGRIKAHAFELDTPIRKISEHFGLSLGCSFSVIGGDFAVEHESHENTVRC